MAINFIQAIPIAALLYRDCFLFLPNITSANLRYNLKIVLTLLFFLSKIISIRRGGKDPALFFQIHKLPNEIDLIMESDGLLYPIEIKRTANPGK